MDMGTLKGLSTVFVMIAFIGVCWWAYAPRRRERFKDAANLPFADDVDQKTKQLHPNDKDEERQD
jgi:cytochrome c oxidase cbb3-type subunit IV